MKHIIRTSDRGTFKLCRQQWDFTSKIRQNYEPNTVSRNLTFGTAVHAGLEAYYHPKLQQQAIAYEAMLGQFMESWLTTKELYEPDDWRDLHELGLAMLRGYPDWATGRDNFGVTNVEVEFEVPIKVPQHVDPVRLPIGFSCRDGELYGLGVPVVYQGRLDLLGKDADGFIIMDHKTAASFGPTDHLEMDDQVTSYAWAMDQIGIPVHTVVYNELRKAAPSKPKVLKSGKLSKDKAQPTTLALYEKALADTGQSPVEYEDHIQWLRDNPTEFYRRTEIHRSKKELQVVGERILWEAIDMLNEPSIYPNPTKFNCNWCDFRNPCLANYEGGDPTAILNIAYHNR